MQKTGMNSTIISVLHQGREFANELRKQLNPSSSSTTTTIANSSKLEAHGFLLEKILLSYDDALALANCMTLLENEDGSDPDSNQNSPTSEGSDPDQGVFKKRKTTPRWSKQVRVCSSGRGLGGQLDDGYSWRKYGQKNILGTNHPRAYYRCTHRNTQGCLATKQVQRTDEDPSIFEVIHHGKHTCVSDNKLEHIDKQQNNETNSISNEQTGLKAEETPELPDSSNKEEQEFPLIFFPSNPIESDNLEDLPFFPDPGNFVGTTSYSSRFLSPTTPDQSYFSPGIGYSFQSSELDFAEIISNPTSFTDFPFGELDFLTDHVDFDSHCFLKPSDYFTYSTADSPTKTEMVRK